MHHRTSDLGDENVSENRLIISQGFVRLSRQRCKARINLKVVRCGLEGIVAEQKRAMYIHGFNHRQIECFYLRQNKRALVRIFGARQKRKKIARVRHRPENMLSAIPVAKAFRLPQLHFDYFQKAVDVGSSRGDAFSVFERSIPNGVLLQGIDPALLKRVLECVVPQCVQAGFQSPDGVRSLKHFFTSPRNSKKTY